MSDLRILLVDDHAIFRHGLRALLSDAIPAAQVCEAGSLEEALALDIPAPNLALLDIKLPGIGGIDGITMLRQLWPETKVIILSGLEAPAASLEALASGAAAYIAKSESPCDRTNCAAGSGTCWRRMRADNMRRMRPVNKP